MLDLDVAWMIGCAGLVFLMQPGFMCLESGLTRSKNSINVAVKNMADIGTSVLLFWTLGYALMFGTSFGGWVGLQGFFLSIESTPQVAAFFIFQVMFCGTATTIVSGAVAERLRFTAYAIVACLISGFIYPIFGHWVWNGLAAGEATGWLGRLGFFDFAGATVVHSIGGWVSLAALLVIGSRTGRFQADGSAKKIHGSNLPFSVLGAMLLWLGWLGFNGGSTLALDDRVPGIIVHTILSGASGMMAAAAISWWRNNLLEVEKLINGSIAGMVSITACCSVVTTAEAFVIGAIGGMLMLWATGWLESSHIDDGVDAVALHGFCGAWSTLAVALFGSTEQLGTGLSPIHQVGVQLFGIGVCFAWGFGVTYGVLSCINRIFPLRVSLEDEELGLNVSEHQAKTEVYELFRVMDEQARTQDFSLRVPETPFTEAGKIARRYNQVMESLESYANQIETFNSQLEQTVSDRTAELAAANQELKRLDKLKDEFLANTSHELRTPLNGMIGIAESMLDGATGTLSPIQQQNLAIVAQSGRRLSNLINDILDFSKLKENTLDLNLKPVALRTLVEMVLALSQSLVGKKNLQLLNAVPADLPAVAADANRLQQILYNLVGNGIKFTESGVLEVSARLLEIRREERQGEELTSLPDSGCKHCAPKTPDSPMLAITVSDTGIGIPQEKIDSIFASFEQGDGSTAREYGGTGLGLAVTKQLVALHGGEIWVETEVGEGSKFTFTLPVSTEMVEGEEVEVVAVREAIASPAPIAPADLDSGVDAGQFQILIVDDEPVNLQVLVNLLSLEKNYAIAQADNGLEAIEAISRGFKPDLILLDVMMPKMTGYEVCQHLRQQFPANELPILLLTAKNQTEDLVKGLASGANDYLTKPINKSELLARLKTQLRLSQLNKAYSYFVPRQFLQFLNKESIIDVALGDQVEREMSVLFADIRNFTTLSEDMTPEENFKFINSYLSQMEPAILEHQGFIDKFIGDAIMALFSHSADDAVMAGIAMLQCLAEYNAVRERLNRTPLQIGIGINTGELMLGTVGGRNRMDGTAIGDTVNLASRIEGLTKEYQVSLLISEQTFLGLANPEQYCLRALAPVKVKGKSEKVAVYEVFDADPPALKASKVATQHRFSEALSFYRHKQFEQAEFCFQDCLYRNRGDTVARIYLERCRRERRQKP